MEAVNNMYNIPKESMRCGNCMTNTPFMNSCNMCNPNMCNINNMFSNTNNMNNVGCQTREEMLEEIRCYKFAITDIGIYLDVHPEDQRALCLHREYCNKYKCLTDKYQKMCGPLTIDFPCNKWRWIDEPWPGERGNF